MTKERPEAMRAVDLQSHDFDALSTNRTIQLPLTHILSALNRTYGPVNIRFSAAVATRCVSSGAELRCAPSSAHLLITTRCFPAYRNSNLNGPKADEFVGQPLRQSALKAFRGRRSAGAPLNRRPTSHAPTLKTQPTHSPSSSL